ncbi:MAG: hypothetical protein MJ234_01040 [bacterium]|nr:hypothetical protein [bacterium]
MNMIFKIAAFAFITIIAPFAGMLFKGLKPFYEIKRLIAVKKFTLGGFESFFSGMQLIFCVAAFVMIILGQAMLLIIFISVCSDVFAAAALMHAENASGPFKGLELLFRTAAYAPIYILFAYSCKVASGTFMISNIALNPPISMIPAVFAAFLMASAFKRGLCVSGKNEFSGELYPIAGPLSPSSKIFFIVAKQFETVIILMLCFVVWPDPAYISIPASCIVLAATDAAGRFIRQVSLSGFIKFFWSAAFILCFGNIFILMLGKI